MKGTYKKNLAAYELADRSNPEKYLYDALDAYFNVLKKDMQTANINDLMLQKIWAADDIENVARGLEYINEENFDNKLKKTVNIADGSFQHLTQRIVQSQEKVRLIIQAMKKRRAKNVEFSI